MLTEKGKSLANVEIPYAGAFRVVDIKARTIHPDGSIVALEGKPEDLLAVKSGDMKVGKKVFTLPSVTVGSILEYRYDLDYPEGTVSSPRWNIQRDYFVHQAHYSFMPFKTFLPGVDNATSRYITDSRTGAVLNNLIWWSSLPPGSAPLKTDATGRFFLDLTDIPARPDEEWMPPIDGIVYRVQFYYKGSYSTLQFWQDEGKRWSKAVDHFAQPSPTLREAVAGLVTPTDSDEIKARKIYAAVQALDNTNYSRARSASEMQQLKIKTAGRAEDVWAQKAGDSNEIALLYLAMLRAAGLKAYALKVVDRSQTLFDYTYLDRSQFSDVLVLFSTGGKDTPLDPGQKMCPFGTMSWRHSDSVALRQTDKGVLFAETAPLSYNANTTARTGDIFINEHGGISGSITMIMTGQQALRWRQAALRSGEADVKQQFDRELRQTVPAGVDAHVDHFLGLNDPSLNLMAVVNVNGSMGAATAKRLLLPGFFFESRNSEPFVQEEKRLEPIDMHYAERISDQITYHLPAKMTVEGTPQDANVPWPQHAVYISRSKTDPGEITVARALIRSFDMLKASDYQDLRGFYQKVATADQQELVLHAAPEVKGN